MRLTHLRQADLNLLVVFTALAEERSVSRAAVRVSLSQPAVSRALQRLRDMFHDDLLVRTPSGYEATQQGQRLLREMEVMLPRLDRLLSGATFDPATEEASFRIAATDYASHVLCPPLCRYALTRGEKIAFDFMAWTDGAFEAVERGRIDLLLCVDDGNLPASFQREVLFDEEFVCVVARQSGYSNRLTLKQYLAAPHIGISTFGGKQTLPERNLAAAGVRRNCAMRVSYFSAAIRSVAGTKLIATVPRRIAEYEVRNTALKIIPAPKVMTGFHYLMAWHPRMNTDAAHGWLRSTMRAVASSIV